MDEMFVYADRLDAVAGDVVSLHASASRAQDATISLVRPTAADGGGAIEATIEPVEGAPSLRARVEPQNTHNGSFGFVDQVELPATKAITLLALIWPTNIDAGAQAVLTARFGTSDVVKIGIDREGRLAAHRRSGPDETVATTGERLIQRQWYLIAATFDRKGIRLVQFPIRSADPGDVHCVATVRASVEHPPLAAPMSLAVGGDAVLTAGDGSRRAKETFDGKIERPTILAGVPFADAHLGEVDAACRARVAEKLTDQLDEWGSRALAAWTFTGGFATNRATSTVPGQPPITLVNAPVRGMTGHNWTGEYLDFRQAPDQYGAVHFHRDDLEDAGWELTSRYRLPEDLVSGCYALVVQGAGVEDHVPLFVRRSAVAAPKDVLMLFPTFTYLAYANSRLDESEELNFGSEDVTDLPSVPTVRDDQIKRHPEFGMSIYDQHADLSGNCFSSILRPVLDLRWDYRMPSMSGVARHFAADLVWPTWLESEDIDFDVLSDHGLHTHGFDSLRDYRLVITGSHPEYWSAAMLESLEQYLDDGGSLAYVGGNGFYWVTSVDDGRPHLLEVRRGQQGIRTWEGEPGEGVSTQSSEPGGLWRLRGRAPNRTVGVGMAAQGFDSATPGYKRTTAADDPRVRDLFSGIDDDVIGDRGLILGGAAGDEIDRADVKLGTPRHALVVATSLPHSKFYLAANEELRIPTSYINGTNNSDVRSDVVFFEHVGGGFVFSTGAITWIGSLAHNGFDNTVSVLMSNVVRRAVE
ncbi:MAG: N,N-dimethylformamidase beta subunit family domain-containing protein [Propionibacteriaceae bacterium]